MTALPQQPTTRTVAGANLPIAGVWTIDPGHTDVAFTGRHFMITKVRGRFRGVSGEIHIADDPNESSVSVDIDMASVDSGDTTRDDHLRSSDLFDVEQHPSATFRSTAVAWHGESGTITGHLTIKGVTTAVTLAASFTGQVHDPWDNDRAIFSAHTRINREDFGVTWNMILETGGLLVSKEIDIDIETETILRH